MREIIKQVVVSEVLTKCCRCSVKGANYTVSKSRTAMINMR